MAGTAADSLRDTVPGAGVAGTADDAVGLVAKSLQLMRIARNSKRKAAARDAWYPVLPDGSPGP